MMRWHHHTLKLALLTILLLVGTALASVSAQSTPLEQIVFDTRTDLELLADSVFGVNTRSDGWIGNADASSPTAITDLWFDNELVANALYGDSARPPTWIGATVPVPAILARNIRHDLEISADLQFGGGQRPETWRGAAPLLRCDRSLQNAVALLNTYYNLQSDIPASTFNYCQAVAADIEDELTNIYFGTQLADQALLDPLDLILAVRGDLERLADEEMGLNTRPDGWIGNGDRESSTLISDVFLDLQRLADEQLGLNVRPDGWIGAVGVSPTSSYFTLRHDLELLADETFAVNERPNGWQGLLPLARCEPLSQQIVFMASVQYNFNVNTLDTQAENFCALAADEANSLVENPPQIESEEQLVSDEDLFISQGAFAYLDVGATRYMGIIPDGTRFRPLYRNFSDSSMMFVAGEDFALYIDRRWTDLPEPLYRALPTLEGVAPISFCNAYWCAGPGPTPTPTGGGPLIALLVQTTPAATPDTGELSIEKLQISWTNVRVTYLADNATTRTAQVTLEVCAQRADVATACEPVTRVFDNSTGTERPPLGQSNGLNIYEMRYGYNTNLIIEGTTRFSTDVWISDPTIR